MQRSNFDATVGHCRVSCAGEIANTRITEAGARAASRLDRRPKPKFRKKSLSFGL